MKKGSLPTATSSNIVLDSENGDILANNSGESVFGGNEATSSTAWNTILDAKTGCFILNTDEDFSDTNETTSTNVLDYEDFMINCEDESEKWMENLLESGYRYTKDTADKSVTVCLYKSCLFSVSLK